MSLITRNAKESRSMNAQQMSQNLPKRSLGDVLSLRRPNHFVLAGANNRNVIIAHRFLAALASHAGVFRGARFSSLPTNACSTEDNIPLPSLANRIVLSKF